MRGAAESGVDVFFIRDDGRDGREDATTEPLLIGRDRGNSMRRRMVIAGLGATGLDARGGGLGVGSGAVGLRLCL